MLTTTHSHCTTKQRYSRLWACCTGLLPSAVLLFRRLLTSHHNRLAPLPLGLLRLRSPLLPKSPLFSSPPSSDMLKSKGFSTTRGTFGNGLKNAVLTQYRSLLRPSSPREPIDPSSALLCLCKPQTTIIDPAAGSPTATLLRLVSNLVARILATESPSSALPS